MSAVAMAALLSGDQSGSRLRGRVLWIATWPAGPATPISTTPIVTITPTRPNTRRHAALAPAARGGRRQRARSGTRTRGGGGRSGRPRGGRRRGRRGGRLRELAHEIQQLLKILASLAHIALLQVGEVHVG